MRIFYFYFGCNDSYAILFESLSSSMQMSVSLLHTIQPCPASFLFCHFCENYDLENHTSLSLWFFNASSHDGCKHYTCLGGETTSREFAVYLESLNAEKIMDEMCSLQTCVKGIFLVNSCILFPFLRDTSVVSLMVDLQSSSALRCPGNTAFSPFNISAP